MEIYLMRHGEAVSQAEWDRDDSTRPLSDRGREQLRDALPYIQKTGFSPSLVLVSPYLRAKQTCEIICSILPGKSPIVSSVLAAGASNSVLKTLIASHAEEPSLLIIGHMPDLAHFASAVTSDPWLLDDARMDPASIWGLDPGNFQTKWGEGKFLWQRNISDWKNL